jgi:hypothetical protein
LQALNALVVLQHQKSATSGPAPDCVSRCDAFALDTCQRTLQIGIGLSRPFDLTGWRVFRGKEAYRFLVEVGCGLHSRMPGEAHVFGQLKQSWASYSLSGTRHATRLQPVMQGIFSDVKRIRARHLQGIGCGSYAKLTMRLLEPEPSDRICIVGAGNLAQSIVPTFARQRLAIWSRRPPAWPLDSKITCHTPGSEALVARWADIIVLCTPPVPTVDIPWAQAVTGARGVDVLHLGTMLRPEAWADSPGFRNLDDLFTLRDQQREYRRARAQAASAQLTERRWRRLGLRRDLIAAGAAALTA